MFTERRRRRRFRSLLLLLLLSLSLLLLSLLLLLLHYYLLLLLLLLRLLLFLPLVLCYYHYNLFTFYLETIVNKRNVKSLASDLFPILIYFAETESHAFLTESSNILTPIPSTNKGMLGFGV